MAAAVDGKPSAELQQLVADADVGGRAAGGFAGKLIFAVAVAWSLFQLWYASPLPFEFGWAILNDTEAPPAAPRGDAPRGGAADGDPRGCVPRLHHARRLAAGRDRAQGRLVGPHAHAPM